MRTETVRYGDDVRGDGVCAVTIAPESMLDCAMVNGQLLQVGQVLWVKAAALAVTAPPWRERLPIAANLTSVPYGWTVALRLWGPGEFPFAGPRAQLRQSATAVVPIGFPVLPQIVVPLVGRASATLRFGALGATVDFSVRAVRWTELDVLNAGARADVIGAGTAAVVPSLSLLPTRGQGLRFRFDRWSLTGVGSSVPISEFDEVWVYFSTASAAAYEAAWEASD